MSNDRMTVVPEFLEELDAGVFINKIAASLNNTALGVLNNGGKGKVVLTFDLERMGNSVEEKRVKIKHKLQYTTPTIAVWFSCGAASAVAAKLTLEKYGKTHSIRIINNPVAEEDEDNRRFLADVEKWLGVKIESAVNPMFPAASAVEIWDWKQYMSGTAGAPCTTQLKKLARKYWEKGNRTDFIVLGFTADESHRVKNFVENEKQNLIPVLVDAGLTKGDCFNILLEAGITLPRIYRQGYPNANCIGCVKATSPTYWNHVRKVHPEVFAQRAEQSRKIGARLVRHKGVRMFLDELPVDAIGRPMKNMDFECGIFCAPATENDDD